ncbi:glycosyltransferase [Rudanella paleaurantiibacter]|uniref:Glycosyltransferase n=1 Tax=Rudanella paleaurantiibacter TaxID=2614655 RepID=A0A7J5TUI2_9BACT|nr:glycosyltransferase [Rudanella paleaurantiibacter]KAB7727664.1 glycosyltransferase [Rudanella paleaurantiibacter]
MKTVLVTAYAVNPYKGSEDGMGWNFILQIARSAQVIAVTRANNQPAIDRYWAEHPELDSLRQRIRFLYFDWPAWLRFWKKGPLLSMIYYYGWQLSLALWLWPQRLPVQLVHNLNFHNDWTPTFLWLLGKPLVWGPVGHHPAVPEAALRPFGRGALLKDRFLWALKRAFWALDPFLSLTKRRAAHVLCMNPSAARVLGLAPHRYTIVPSVASEPVSLAEMVPTGSGSAEVDTSEADCFRVLSVGRFVPLKGFTSTVRAFGQFHRQLSRAEQSRVRLTLVGSGPAEPLIRQLLAQEGLMDCTDIINWLPKHEVADCYRSASVFLFPSHEGAGMVVAEAMSYGLPVLCWDNEGPGQLVPPDSELRVPDTDLTAGEVQMARHLLRLFRHPDYLRHESQLARQRFETAFAWSVRGEQIRQIYAGIPGIQTS